MKFDTVCLLLIQLNINFFKVLTVLLIPDYQDSLFLRSLSVGQSFVVQTLNHLELQTICIALVSILSFGVM